MKRKTWLWLAAGMILLGALIFVGVMTMLKWDFTKLSTIKYQTKEYVFSESVSHISIETNTSNITFQPSADGQTRVVCHEQERMQHGVTVQDGTLRIKVTDTRKWYHNIGISFDTTKITLYLPSDTYETVSLKLSTGNVNISQLTCLGDISIKVSTGKVTMTDVSCQNLLTTGSTGSITLKNVIAAEKMDILRSTGDVRFDGCDAAELSVKTDTGDIKGSLLTEKIFVTRTDTGKIQVPKSTSGGVCEMTTDTGDIIIQCKP